MTAPAPFLPVLTVPDRDDAAVVFDALSAALAVETDPTRRQRLATLVVAAHAEERRAR